MKTPERFDRALKALVQAFFNDTLVPSQCQACAVGNIIAYSNGIKLIKTGTCNFSGKPEFERFYNGYDVGAYYHYWQLKEKEDQAKHNAASTGYTLDELYKVERAFMEGPYSGDVHDYYLKLMAVVDVLCQIEGLDAQEYKKAFEYNQDLTPVYQS